MRIHEAAQAVGCTQRAIKFYEEKKLLPSVARSGNGYREYTDEDIEAVIGRLIAKSYLDDVKFTEYYLENRFQKKGISGKRLKLELQKKGISPETIEQVFAKNPRDETEEIKKIISRKRSRYSDEQMMKYLMRQGFNFDLIKLILNQN